MSIINTVLDKVSSVVSKLLSLVSSAGSNVMVSRIVLIAVLVIMIISLAVLFNKARRHVIKAIIPVLNGYTAFNLCWHGFWYLIMLACCIVAFYFNSSDALFSLFAAAAIIIYVIGTWKFSKAYGHGIIFTIGLLILPVIFLPIMAAVSDYEGKW